MTITVSHIARWKQEGRSIAVLTAWDYLSAQIVDAAGIDVVLVGDSDIERWPPDLAPHGTVKIRGQSGATLEQVLPLMKAVLEEYQQQQQPLTIVF